MQSAGGRISAFGFIRYDQWPLVHFPLRETPEILLALACIVLGAARAARLWRGRQSGPTAVLAGLCVGLGGYIVSQLVSVGVFWHALVWSAVLAKLTALVAGIPTAALLAREVKRRPRASTVTGPSGEDGREREQALLRQSEERFQQMAANIQEIFWTMDPHTKKATYVSPAFEKICELPLESIYENPISYLQLIHPEDRQAVIEGLDKLEAADGFDQEFRIVCPSGTVKWLRAIGFQAKDAAGAVQTFVGTAQEITARKLMEAALRESEDVFRDMVEHSSDLICTHTLEGRILTVNEMPVKVLGYTREEMLAKPMREFLLPAGREAFDESMKVIVEQGFVKGLMVVLTKSGERRIWEYHNTLRTDGVSVPIVRGVAHDVTEQKRIERALRMSEEKFSRAFQASPYGIVISTIEDGKLVDVNDSFLRIMGLTRQECIGRTSREIGIWTRPDDREEILKEVQETGHVKSKQIGIQKRGGEQLVVNYTGEAIEVGGRRCLLSVCEDITERKQAETRLREYEKAVEGVEEMIAVVDRNYRYLLANRAFVGLKGMAQEQVVGHLIAEVLGQEPFEREIKDKIDEAFGGKSVKFNLRYEYPVVGWRDVYVSYFPIEGPSGIDRIVCILQDVTERNQTEQELRRLSRQLLKLQDEERRKIARDLHDQTGQDLVALATMVSQLRETIPASSRKGRKLATQCKLVAERCLREVRTVSYLLHPPMLDESGLEDAMRDFAAGFGERTGIEVELKVSLRFGRLRPDVELGLFRVIQESLTNIQRHSGSYTANIQLDRDAEKVSLRVADTGRGIAASKRRQSGPKPSPAGVGIPSMEERVRQVGGQLRIESSASGTAVFVTVPFHE